MQAEPPFDARRDIDWIEVRLSGDIDMANAPSIERDTLEIVHNEDAGVTIDLTNVDYIDSAGIRALVEMRRMLGERQQRLLLVVPEDSVLRKALTVGGVMTVIEVHPSAESARAARS